MYQNNSSPERIKEMYSTYLYHYNLGLILPVSKSNECKMLVKNNFRGKLYKEEFKTPLDET